MWIMSALTARFPAENTACISACVQSFPQACRQASDPSHRNPTGGALWPRPTMRFVTIGGLGGVGCGADVEVGGGHQLKVGGRMACYSSAYAGHHLAERSKFEHAPSQVLKRAVNIRYNERVGVDGGQMFGESIKRRRQALAWQIP